MSAGSHLIGASKVEQDSKDELMAALTTLARPLGLHAPIPNELRRKHKSRFFFTPTSSVVQEVEESKKAMAPKKMIHVTDEVDERTKQLGVELPPVLQTHITRVREYFLTQLTPRILAISVGAEQAKQAIQQLLDTEVDPGPFIQFEQMARYATRIKMAQYLTRHFKLPPDKAQDLVDALTPIRREMLVPQGPAHPAAGEEERPKQKMPTTPMMSRPQRKAE